MNTKKIKRLLLIILVTAAAVVLVMRPFCAFSFRQKSLFIPGCVQGAILFNLSVGMCVCVCVTFVVFTDCERCTRPISTNPGSMESREYGSIACRLELHAVAGLLWVSSCVLGGADFSVIFFFFDFIFLRTHTACCKYEATLHYLHLCWYRVAYRVPLFTLSVCVRACVTLVVFTDCKSCSRPISTNPGSMESGDYGLTRGTRSIACRLELHAVAGLLWISWCALGGADFSVLFFLRFFFLRTHTACCKYEATLHHLPLY